MFTCGKHRHSAGFSLVELMVGVAVGMFGILAIMQMFTVSEASKRATVAGADAQENGLMALFTIERDMRNSGFGLVGMGCTTIKAYNENLSPQDYNMSALPVEIARDAPAAGTDQITILYSASAYGGVPATITSAMPDSSAILNVNNGLGFYQSDLVIISEPPKDCSLVQLSQDGQKTGGTWNLQHNPGGTYVYNPPGGHNIFPPGGYGSGAKLTNMGNLVNRRYYVENDRLMMLDPTTPTSSTNPIALVDNIVALRAQYGRDTDADGFWNSYDNTAPAAITEIVSARIAVVARSTDRAAVAVSPATLVLWSGGTTANGGAISLDANAQRYRYKVYVTTIPLRNVLWAV